MPRSRISSSDDGRPAAVRPRLSSRDRARTKPFGRDSRRRRLGTRAHPKHRGPGVTLEADHRLGRARRSERGCVLFRGATYAARLRPASRLPEEPRRLRPIERIPPDALPARLRAPRAGRVQPATYLLRQATRGPCRARPLRPAEARDRQHRSRRAASAGGIGRSRTSTSIRLSTSQPSKTQFPMRTWGPTCCGKPSSTPRSDRKFVLTIWSSLLPMAALAGCAGIRVIG
jgi:hypothetical protein